MKELHPVDKCVCHCFTYFTIVGHTEGVFIIFCNVCVFVLVPVECTVHLVSTHTYTYVYVLQCLSAKVLGIWTFFPLYKATLDILTDNSSF